MDKGQEIDIVKAILANQDVKMPSPKTSVDNYREMRKQEIDPIPAAILANRVTAMGSTESNRKHVRGYFRRYLSETGDPLVSAILASTGSEVWPADKWPGEQVLKSYERLEQELGDEL